MKVCATILLGPWNITAQRFDTVTAAVDYFRNEVAGIDYGTGTDEQIMDLYPQCELCVDQATYHDYPLARYAVGPRGGIKKEII